jgi:hypothetical protein
MAPAIGQPIDSIEYVVPREAGRLGRRKGFQGRQKHRHAIQPRNSRTSRSMEFCHISCCHDQSEAEEIPR